MCLPIRLYQAPVESDVQSKPAAEKTAAHARSSIRRGPLRSADGRSSSHAARARHRRILAAGNAPYLAPSFAAYSTDHRSPLSDGPARQSASGAANAADVSDNGGRALRQMANRLGILDEREVAAAGERWAHLHAESNPSPLRDGEDDELFPLSAMAVEADFLPRRVPPAAESYAMSSMRSTQAPNHPVRVSLPHKPVVPLCQNRASS